jgi:NitT/TauT family transport system substrate-binding protein
MAPWLVLLQAALTISVAGPATSLEYLPLRVAEAEGYFAAERIAVSLQSQRAEPGAAEALARGEVALAATSLDAALRLGHVAGAPPRLVFGLTAAPPAALVVGAIHRDAIRGLQDLVGKRIGIPAPGTPEHHVIAGLLHRARIRLRQVTLMSFGERRLPAALQAGEVEAAVLGEPYASRLIGEGRAAVLVDFRRPGEAARWLGPTVHAAVFVRADTALGRDELVPLARALLRALRRVETARAEELQARLPAEVVERAEEFPARLAALQGVLLSGGRVTADMLEGGIALARERAPLPARVDLPWRPERLLFLEPLKEAQGGGQPR